MQAPRGKLAVLKMIDVGAKGITRREATARGALRMSAAALRLLKAGRLPKGDALAAARVAGILAAKRTGDIVPLCHPLPVEAVDMDIRFVRHGVEAEAVVRTSAKTGVEMEALTAVCAACLTIYDMAKSVDPGMTIGPVFLVEKKGGRSGHYRRGA